MISPSADRGLMIWGRTLADWTALRLRFLGVDAVGVETVVEVTAVLVDAEVEVMVVVVVEEEEAVVGIGMAEGEEEESVICWALASEVCKVGMKEELTAVRTTGVVAMVEVGLDDSFRIF